jgi:hypothetical protein
LSRDLLPSVVVFKVLSIHLPSINPFSLKSFLKVVKCIVIQGPRLHILRVVKNTYSLTLGHSKVIIIQYLAEALYFCPVHPIVDDDTAGKESADDWF